MLKIVCLLFLFHDLFRSFFQLFIKMKVVNTHQEVTVPEGIDVSVKARVVTVKGARGTLVKDFRHLAVDMYMPQKNIVKVS